MASRFGIANAQTDMSGNPAAEPFLLLPPFAQPDAAQLKEKLANLSLKHDISEAPHNEEVETISISKDEDSSFVLGNGVDSGYGSTASTPDSNNPIFPDPPSVPASVPHFLDKLVPQQQQDRFFDFKFLYTRPLWEAVSKKNKKAHPGDIGMKLKYIGIDEQSARLCIVVQCEKRIAKRVRTFFAQEHIQQYLKPDFEVHILSTGVIRLSGEHNIQVLAELGRRSTLCGLKICIIVDGAQAMATFGGLIMVTSGATTNFFGLTAGHPLEPSDGDTESDDQDSDRFTDPDSMSELEESDTCPQPSHPPDRKPMTFIGTIAHDSLHSSTSSANCDWALINLSTSAVCPNLFPTCWPLALSNTELIPCRVTLQPQQKIGVVVLTSHGLQRGSLASNGSSIMMSPGMTFVQTLDLVLHPDSVLLAGDSGSWVVNDLTNEVYGHVISVDALGEANVVPLQSTLSDIRTQLGADDVAFPTSTYLAASFLPCADGQEIEAKKSPTVFRSDSLVAATVVNQDSAQSNDSARKALESKDSSPHLGPAWATPAAPSDPSGLLIPKGSNSDSEFVESNPRSKGQASQAVSETPTHSDVAVYGEPSAPSPSSSMEATEASTQNTKSESFWRSLRRMRKISFKRDREPQKSEMPPNDVASGGHAPKPSTPAVAGVPSTLTLGQQMRQPAQKQYDQGIIAMQREVAGIFHNEIGSPDSGYSSMTPSPVYIGTPSSPIDTSPTDSQIIPNHPPTPPIPPTLYLQHRPYRRYPSF